MSRDADEAVETLRQALASNNEGPPSPFEGKPPNPAARASHSSLASAVLCAIVQLMVQVEAECIYANHVNAFMTRAAKEALSDAFQIG